MPEYKYLVQEVAARMLNADANNDLGQCQNMRLLLSRYVPREVIHDETFEQSRGNNPKKKDTKRHQDVWMQNTINRFDTRQSGRDWQGMQQATFARWLAMTEHLPTIRFEGQLMDRMVVGLGGGGVLETGITLHHVTGLPIIPGSALKGMTRAYALFSVAAAGGRDASNEVMLTQLEEQLADADYSINKFDASMQEAVQFFRHAFGTTQEAGWLVFYDAIVSGWDEYVSNIYDIDIMNPHFGKYYSSDGKQAPSDDENPIPIKFITVSAGIRFGFAMGVRAGITLAQVEEDTYRNWFISGLTEMGVGAKTRSGYGMFEILGD